MFRADAAGDPGRIRLLAVKGVGFTFLSGGAGLATQLVATIVLARLLTPSDFGVVAMVTTFSLLLINFGLNGFTEAIIQRSEMTHELASTLFWINVVGGALLMILFAAAGRLLAWFYRDQRVESVAVGVSITILLTSLSVIHLALLKRAMDFRGVSVNDVMARLSSVAVSILLGWAGWGYWALVGGAIALGLSTAVGAWYLCRWLPGRPRNVTGLGEMVRFALHTYGSFSVNYSSRNVDNLLVGWRFSATSLGYYKKAYDLFAVCATQLVSSSSIVVVSALSRLRDDMSQYRRHLLAAIGVMAFIGMGVGADLTLVGKDLIRLLLGSRWAPAGRIFTLFGPGIGIMIVYYTYTWIHLSIGHPERWLRWTIIELAVTLSLFLIALPYGPDGIALAWTTSFWILVVPAMWYAGNPISLGIVPVLQVIWRYVAASLCAAGITAWILAHMDSVRDAAGAEGALLRLTVVSALSLVIYAGAVVALHGGPAPLRTIYQMMRQLFGPSVAAPESPKPAMATN